MTTNKAGRFMAKALVINLDYRKEHQGPISSNTTSTSSVEPYVEREPTAKEYLTSFKPTVGGLKHYLHSLFPFVSWIFHYNLTWLFGDVIAGVTVGFVAIPNHKKFWFFLSTLRMTFIILLYILISYLANRNINRVAKNAKFKILGKVPRGFQHTGAPNINIKVLKAIAPDLPVTIIVLILEHIAISKSFGRINNYVINPSQELVAVGFTNVFGPFLGAYPATGSFSRTAIKSKAGVRTPLAGLFTAIIVLLALYALTALFFYIPSTSLAAIIIHAVGDLITPPKVVYQFWETSLFEVIIFFAGVLLTIFTNIENGIYLTIATSLALLLWRHLKSHGAFLGKVDIYRATTASIGQNEEYGPGAEDRKVCEAFIPIDHHDGSNPQINVNSPYPGVLVYQFSEGFTYLNQQHYMDELVAHAQHIARPTKLDRFTKIGDRPWNDPGPRRDQKIDLDDSRPILRAIVLDFSSVNHVDVTSVQGLVDVRTQLDRYATPEQVEWHFAAINNRWTKRALTPAGFGYISSDLVDARSHWTPVYSFAAVGDESPQNPKTGDVEAQDEIQRVSENQAYPGKLSAVHGQNRPYFHIDVPAAVESAISGIESKLLQGSPSSSQELPAESGDNVVDPHANNI